MAKLYKALASVLIIFLVSISSFFLGYHFYIIGVPIFGSKNASVPGVINESLRLVQQKYYEPVSKDKLIDGAVEGIISSLDNPYAQYLNKKSYGAFQNKMSGSYSGVGMSLDGKKGHVFIGVVFEDSPALAAGIKANDVVLKIDNKDASNMTPEQAKTFIRGKPGTKVKIVMRRAGAKKTFIVTRQSIDFPNIISKMKSNNTGYIMLHSFTDDVGEKIRKEITKLKNKGATSLILDLRGNPGGELTEAINVTSLFLKDGLVVKTVNRKNDETTYNASGDVAFSGKMVVLVDDGSASASEIVAGALKDHDRAKIIGMKTFGKGSVQEVVMLSNGGAMIIPSQQWLTPAGYSITKRGIKPNIVIKNPSKQLSKALDYLKD